MHFFGPSAHHAGLGMLHEHMVKVGQQFPDFTLHGYYGGETRDYTISKYKGRWLVLFFYPLDFTFVCPTEVKGFNDHFDEFQKAKADILGVSVDSVHSHNAWVMHEFGGKLNYPLLSDFNKEITELLGIDTTDSGGLVALRATFIVDPKGILRYMVVSDNNVGRSVSETLRVVKALQTGGLCPVDWKPGEKLLKK